MENKSNNLNQYLVLALIICSFVIGNLWAKLNEKDSVNVPTTQQPQQAAAPTPTVLPVEQEVSVLDTDHVRGNPEANIIIIEYSDLECPYCQKFHSTVQQVVNNSNNEVAWVYRHFPLNQIHPSAQLAAEASECIGAQGGSAAFWSFIDAIFDGDVQLNKDSMSNYVTSVGLNSSQFDTCIESETYKEYVAQSLQQGSEYGIRGTPGTIIYNKQTNEAVRLTGGAVSAQVLQAEVDKLR